MPRPKDAKITTYQIASPRWHAPNIKIAVLSDLHVGAPWVPIDQVDHWIDQANALHPDLIVQAGDMLMDEMLRRVGRPADALSIVDRLKRLKAPLGVWSVLGNHDWTDCTLARQTRSQRNSVAEALAELGLPHLDNAAVQITHSGSPIWVIGLNSRKGDRFDGAPGDLGYDDPEAAFAAVPEGASAILIAHEPNVFDEGDGPYALQISGHTHAGQIAFGNWRPFLMKDYRAKLSHGHLTEGQRHLVISAGLGFSGLPIRFGAPSEILSIDLSQSDRGGDP
ncbi:MAG: metallophosphoesterase [Pseudomonadota bacterium]